MSDKRSSALSLFFASSLPLLVIMIVPQELVHQQPLQQPRHLSFASYDTIWWQVTFPISTTRTCNDCAFSPYTPCTITSIKRPTNCLINSSGRSLAMLMWMLFSHRYQYKLCVVAGSVSEGYRDHLGPSSRPLARTKESTQWIHLQSNTNWNRC